MSVSPAVEALLDTHTLAWFAWDFPELPASIKNILQSPQTNLRVSIASFWEMGIKIALGKWNLPGDVLALQTLAEAQGIQIIPISVAAVHLIIQMPMHHKDPFDRIIAATALTSGSVLFSSDAIFDLYGVPRRWE